jgi:hypothetical protein
MEIEAAAAVAPDQMTVRGITAALAKAVHERYPAPEYLCLQQVAIGTRWLDLVAVRMWSRAAISAFEVKATRSDWLREMRQPTKADVAVGTCDHFWLVTAKGVAKPEEIPEHWGWLVMQANGKVRAAKAAPALDTRIPHREFWASMLSRLYNGGESRGRIGNMKQAEYERGYRLGREHGIQSLGDDELTQARRALESLGWSDMYQLAQRAPAIKAALAADRAAEDIERLCERAQDVAARLAKVLKDVRS